MKTKLLIAMLLCTFTLPLLALAQETEEERTYINSRNIVVVNNQSDDGSGMGEQSYSVDGGKTWSVPVAYTAEANLTLPDLAEGEHCIQAKYSDQVGNWGEVKEACAMVDTIGPDGQPSIKGIKIITEIYFR